MMMMMMMKAVCHTVTRIYPRSVRESSRLGGFVVIVACTTLLPSQACVRLRLTRGRSKLRGRQRRRQARLASGLLTGHQISLLGRNCRDGGRTMTAAHFNHNRLVFMAVNMLVSAVTIAFLLSTLLPSYEKQQGLIILLLFVNNNNNNNNQKIVLSELDSCGLHRRTSRGAEWFQPHHFGLLKFLGQSLKFEQTLFVASTVVRYYQINQSIIISHLQSPAGSFPHPLRGVNTPNFRTTPLASYLDNPPGGQPQNDRNMCPSMAPNIIITFVKYEQYLVYVMFIVDSDGGYLFIEFCIKIENSA